MSMEFTFDSFQTLIQNDPVFILDTRQVEDLLNGYVPNSIHAPKQHIGKLIAMGFIQIDSPIVLITDPTLEQETLLLFQKLGFSNIKGFLKGGYQTWLAGGGKIDLLIEVDIDELAMDIPFDEYLMILDIRSEDQYHQGHIKNSISLPLFELVDPGNMSELDEHFNIYILSEDGADASIAATLLKKEGIHNNRIVFSGWEGVMQLKEKFTIEVSKPTPKKEELD